MAKREFNKAEALRRYRAGEKVTAIAEAMGATKAEVYNAIRELKRAEEWGAVKASGSGAAESAAVPSTDCVSGADNITNPPEGETLSEGVPVAEAGMEKPAPKKRGRKKKAEEKPLNISDIQAAVMGNTSDDKEDCKGIEKYAVKPEAWADRKIQESNSPETYFVKLKDGTELTIDGVTKIIDGRYKVTFAGNSCKAVVVSAAELAYYHIKDCKTIFGSISVE